MRLERSHGLAATKRLRSEASLNWSRACSRLPALALFGAVLTAAPGWAEIVDAAPPSAGHVLEVGLANLNPVRYERMSLTNYRGTKRGFRRELEVWIDKEASRYKVYGDFASPELVRGTAFLIIPPKEPGPGKRVLSNQYFVYLPASRIVRRISGAQRADPFFGTVLSQGDAEPHPATDYAPIKLERGKVDVEDVYEITVEPRFEAGYDRAIFAFAVQDFAIMKIEQYRDGRDQPIRTIVTKRSWLETIDGHVLPKRLVAEDGYSDRTTEIEYTERRLENDLPDAMFSTVSLQKGR